MTRSDVALNADLVLRVLRNPLTTPLHTGKVEVGYTGRWHRVSVARPGAVPAALFQASATLSDERAVIPLPTRSCSLMRRQANGSSTIRYDRTISRMASEAGALIREARRRAGLSQSGFGRRAGVTQSVISAYESGVRQPSVPMLTRLVEAAGMRLDLRVRRPASMVGRLRGPLGRRVRARRAEIVAVAARHGAGNVRVFGSVARGEESADSDVDLLVDLAPGTGLLGLGRLERELRTLLGANVDVVPAEDLQSGLAADALAEAVPL